VFAVPLVVSGNSVVCSGKEAQLTASGAQSYDWINIGNFATISVTPAATSVYTVVGTTPTLGLNCSETQTFQVNVNPNPTVNATASPSVLCSKTESSKLMASGANSYSWSNQATTQSITVSSNFQGVFNYTVVGTDANNCTNSVSVLIQVNACTGIESYLPGSNRILVYPNPGQAEFNIQSESAQELDLVNELGQIVLHIKLNESNQHKVTVTGLAAGIYLLRGRQADGVISQRIIISR
jgi:hypothetical protein